ncbi:MAG: general stress protein [Candidatus Levyibacteriota bacterium]
MTETILGIFTDRSDVEEAISKLQGKGFNPKDISIVMRDKAEAKDIGHDTGANVAGGALSGATTGAAVGGIAGLLAGTILPGLGGFLIGGPIGAALGLTGAAATTVSGVATGAVAGGLIGALMGLGLKKDEAEHYESRVKEGAILLAVPAGAEEAGIVTDIFEEYNATDVKTIAQTRDDMQQTTTKRVYADQEQEQTEKVTSSHQQTHHVASAGAKGGTSSDNAHKGWHGDSKHHAQAGKGNEPHHAKGKK